MTTLQHMYSDLPSFADTFTGPRGHSLLPGGYGRGTFAVGPRTPLVRSASGCIVTDDEGREVFDLHGNFTVQIHGSAHPEITDAAVAALHRGSAFGLPNEYEIAHAAHMIARLPYLDQIRYTCSGTEAVMLTVRLARAATGRTKVVFVRGAYHGHSDTALAVGGESGRRGIPDSVLADIVDVPLNDMEALDAVFADSATNIAAVVVDTASYRAGLVAVEPEFWQSARALTTRAGAVLVSDEVIALRMNHSGDAVTLGATPDVVVMGKIIGGGMPVGAVAGTAAIMATLNPLAGGIEHAGTFTANPVTMAAGLVSMELLAASEIQRINALGDSLRARLETQVADSGWQVRGRGSLLCPVQVGVDSAVAARALWWAAYQNGVLLGQNGAAAISTAMDQRVVDDVAERLAASIASVSASMSA